MKYKLLSSIILQVLIVCSFTLAQNDSEIKKPPYTKEVLIKAIRLKGFSAKELIEAIEKRGVDFEINEDIEDEFKSAGASKEVIASIDANYRGKPKEKETPVSSTTQEELEKTLQLSNQEAKPPFYIKPNSTTQGSQPTPENKQTVEAPPSAAQKRAAKINVAPTVIDSTISGEWEGVATLSDPSDKRRTVQVSFTLKIVAEKMSDDYATVTGEYTDESETLTIKPRSAYWERGRLLYIFFQDEKISITGNYKDGRLWGPIGMPVGDSHWGGQWEGKKKKENSK